MGEIVLDGVSKEYVGGVLAVDDVSLTIGSGEFMVLVGPSGCGKSTLLRIVAGIYPATAGTVEVDGQDLRSLGDADLRTLRNDKVSMVFQHFALLPHRTVRENAAYALKVRGVPTAEQRQRADWALRTVGLLDRADARPDQLSGGMQQRVGLARALAADSDVLLMDEPFSALDPLIRRDMQELLIRLQTELHKTIVFITHDLNEAMRLGDRILLLKDGRTVQLGTGPEIISSPADAYVADFVSDVDRTRVLTAADTMSESCILASIDEPPAEVLRRLEDDHTNGVYVLDGDGRIAGVARNDLLAKAIGDGASAVTLDCLTDDYATTTADRPLIDLVELVGRHVVPLAVVDGDGRLLGVLPRAGLLGAMVSNSRSEVHA